MKHSVFHKIPTVILWLCLLITLILSIWFYIAYLSQSVDTESLHLATLLFWLFTLFILNVFTGFVFSFVYYIWKLKENPKKIIRSLTIAISSGLVLLIAWVTGSGNQLPLVDYKGNENTYLWLKLTDMWLYSIYILLGFVFLALVGGIIWSKFKKLN